MTSLLTLPQAARQLQVSPRTVRRLMETGALPNELRHDYCHSRNGSSGDQSDEYSL